MSFKDYLQEAAGKHGVLAYGRMNPPTAGHEQLVDKIHSVAKEHGAVHHLVLSHSHASKDGSNPLPPDVKLKHAKRAFPGTHISSASKEAPSILHHAAAMHKQGVEHLHFVGGSDRKPMHELLKKYNGKEGSHGHYNFKSITFHNAGDRDEKSTGTAGISGTKLRAHAAAGEQHKFESHLSSKMKPAHKTALYHDLRHHMGIKEVFDPHLKVSEFQWGEKKGVDKMKRMTPGEGKTTFKEYDSYRRKLPVLLMNETQKRELMEATAQLEFDGIQTTSFDMCPKAYEQFKDMIETIRAGKHIGEVTGHNLKSDTSQNTDKIQKVEAGMAVKPERMRQMQFRQYTGI